MVPELEEVFERDDRILLFVLMRFRPKGSSAVLEIRIGHLWTMRDGKGARCEVFPMRTEALEAIGMSEQNAHVDASRRLDD